jgi:hypothetical protein
MSEQKEIKKENFTYCDGGVGIEKICPLKDTCARFKENINKLKEYHFAFAPYEPAKQKCSLKL